MGYRTTLAEQDDQSGQDTRDIIWDNQSADLVGFDLFAAVFHDGSSVFLLWLQLRVFRSTAFDNIGYRIMRVIFMRAP